MLFVRPYQFIGGVFSLFVFLYADEKKVLHILPSYLFGSWKQCALIAVDEILNLEPPELSYLEPFSKSWWQEV